MKPIFTEALRRAAAAAKAAKAAALAASNRTERGTVLSPVPGYEPSFGWHERPKNPNIRYGNPQGWHTGTDWAAPEGTPVVAVREGTVVLNNWDDDYGNKLDIRDLRTGRIWRYCHLKEKPDLRIGQKVKAGQQVGRVGTTGKSTGSHLHMELSRGRNWIYNDTLNPVGNF